MVLELPGGLFGQEDVRETPTSTVTSAEAVPIGAVLAWFKTLSGVPSISDGYVQCDGQVLNDSDSPLNGETIPNLNGGDRFLRGNSTSGGTGGGTTSTASGNTNTTGDHFHTLTNVSDLETTGGAGLRIINNQTSETGDHLHTFSDSFSIIPTFTSVVWIMRVK